MSTLLYPLYVVIFLLVIFTPGSFYCSVIPASPSRVNCIIVLELCKNYVLSLTHHQRTRTISFSRIEDKPNVKVKNLK